MPAGLSSPTGVHQDEALRWILRILKCSSLIEERPGPAPAAQLGSPAPGPEPAPLWSPVNRATHHAPGPEHVDVSCTEMDDVYARLQTKWFWSRTGVCPSGCVAVVSFQTARAHAQHPSELHVSHPMMNTQELAVRLHLN